MEVWLDWRLPTCMNTMVRMTPMTSQTMMVRIVLFTGLILPRKSREISEGWTRATVAKFGRRPGYSRGRTLLFVVRRRGAGPGLLQPAREQVLLGALAAGGVGLA